MWQAAATGEGDRSGQVMWRWTRGEPEGGEVTEVGGGLRRSRQGCRVWIWIWILLAQLMCAAQ